MALWSVSGGSVSAGRKRSRAASTAATRSFLYAPRSKVIGSRPPGKPSPVGPASSRKRSSGRVRVGRPRPAAWSLDCRGSPVLVLVERERPRFERAALVPRQELDALLGLVEILGAAAREAHALLEDLEGLLQSEVAGLELVHDPLDTLERVLKLDVAHLASSPAPRARRARLRDAASR